MQAETKGKAVAKGKHAAKPCPICGKPASAESRPFCSERCRDVDLHHWLSGSYVIAATEDDEDNPGGPPNG